VSRAGDKPLVISDYDPSWPTRFRGIGELLRDQLGAEALRIDHIGSTSVPGLPAKDLIDVQVTVEGLDTADRWPDELSPGLTRRPEIRGDHIPSGAPADTREWTKRYWSARQGIHLHVREQRRLNQRYALLFRDYLRADSAAAGAYGQVKRALAQAVPDDWDIYYAVKDPACDLIMAAAEHWAVRVGWTPPATDA
jgi:GrpB-like predicted nucleotidyltransferase (UPF0157 family)